jgi:hypothetical protein
MHPVSLDTSKSFQSGRRMSLQLTANNAFSCLRIISLYIFILHDSCVSLVHIYNKVLNLSIWVLSFVGDLKNVSAVFCCVTFSRLSALQVCRGVVSHAVYTVCDVLEAVKAEDLLCSLQIVLFDDILELCILLSDVLNRQTHLRVTSCALWTAQNFFFFSNSLCRRPGSYQCRVIALFLKETFLNMILWRLPRCWILWYFTERIYGIRNSHGMITAQWRIHHNATQFSIRN